MSQRRRAIGILLIATCLWGFEWPGRVDRLARELTRATPERREEIVRLLGEYPTPRVSDALLAALDDPELNVRLQAADSAARAGLTSAANVLGRWLGDPHPQVRSAAARNLGRLGDATAATSLVRLLADGETSVRLAAIHALAEFPSSLEAVPALVARLVEDLDDEVRIAAADVLGHYGDARAVVPLLGKASDDFPVVRRAVFQALGELGDPRALSTLLKGSEDTDEAARIAAVSGIGRLGQSEALTTLAQLLEHPDPRTAQASLAALGQLDDDEAVKVLVHQLARPDLRAASLLALEARLNRTPAVTRPHLVRVLTGALGEALTRAEEADHVTSIADALTTAADHGDTKPAASVLLDALNNERGPEPPLLMALGMTGAPEARMPLVERLAHVDPAHVPSLLAALDQYFDAAGPDGRAADPLLALLDRVPLRERPAVVRLLGKTGAPRVVPVLRDLLSHESARLQLAAVAAIGQVAAPEGTQALLPLLSASRRELRLKTAQAVARTATAADLPVLIDRLDAASGAGRRATLVALGPLLRRLAEQDEIEPRLVLRLEVRLEDIIGGADAALAAAAIDTLRVWAPPSATRLLGRLWRHPEQLRRLEAITALGSFARRDALEALRFLLARGSTLEIAAAAGALGEHGEARDIEPLLTVAERRPWPANAAGAFALARLARRSLLDSGAWTSRLCALAIARREPYVRANLTVALSHSGAIGCGGRLLALEWLQHRHTPPVRAAAAHWARRLLQRDDARARRGALQAALTHCMHTAPDSAVVDACKGPLPTEYDQEVGVYAEGPRTSSAVTHRLVALRLSDASALIVPTDANTHIRLSRAPRGAVSLEDPHAIRLEPAR